MKNHKKTWLYEDLDTLHCNLDVCHEYANLDNCMQPYGYLWAWIFCLQTSLYAKLTLC